MSSLYAATELGTDFQTLGFLGHHAVDTARMATFRKSLGLPVPRIARWVLRLAYQHGIARAELCGWIVRGEPLSQSGGLPVLLGTGKPDPDPLPSAFYGGLLRLGQTPNGELWGADLHRKSASVSILDTQPDGIRVGWRRRFDRLDDFVFFAAKATLCQRDRITLEEFFDVARERGVRPEELVPDALEDEREHLARMGLRRAKRVSPIANRFIWLDVVLAKAYLRGATPNDVAKLWVDVHGLHKLNEEHDRLSDPSAASFWLLRHALFNDEAGYKRVLAKSPKDSPLVYAAQNEARRITDRKKPPFDRAAITRAIELRAATRR